MSTSSLVSIAIGQFGAQILNQVNSDLGEKHENLSCLAVDAESKVVSSKNFQNLDSRSLIFQESGSGNNYFQGNQFASRHNGVGKLYGNVLEATIDALRYELEKLDHFTGFLLLHSLGGGTGSGFSGQVLNHLSDHYHTPIKANLSCLPEILDVGPIQSYNTILSLAQNTKLVDFTLLTQSKLKNEQISLDLQPLHAKNFLFDLKHNLAPLEDLKFITSASIESRSVLNNLSSFSKLNQEIDKKYQNRWKSSPTMDSNLQNSRRLDYFKFDSKNDLYLIKMQELAQEKTDELVDPAIQKHKFYDPYLNQNFRQWTVFHNNTNFISHLEPILNSCRSKFKKRAYLHHFESDQIEILQDSIDYVESIFVNYSSF